MTAKEFSRRLGRPRVGTGMGSGSGTTSVLRAAAVLVSLTLPASGARPADAEPGPLEAEDILETADIDRGIGALVGTHLGELAIDLARSSELLIYLQSPDPEDARRARATAERAGLLGSRIWVAQGFPEQIHLGDNLADVIVLGGDARSGVAAEALRVARPGAAIIGSERKLSKPVPEGAGEWSHPYHGPDQNPLADDTIARAPYRTQFLATPWYGPMPEVTVSSGGRLFKAFGHIAFKEREWPLLNRLIALNAYNGVTLWERELEPGFMVHRNTLVATPSTLFLGDNRSLKLIDAATGKVRDEIVIPAPDGPSWKWLALEGGVLYALVGEEEPLEDVLRGERKASGWPWSGLGKGYARKDYPWGFGRAVLALDPATGDVLWRHREEEVIDARALCANERSLFVYSHGEFLAALALADGEVRWRTSSPELLEAIGEHDRAQNPRRGFSSSSYAKASERAVFFAGPQRRRLVAVSAEDGRLLWQRRGGNYQLVLHPDGLYALGRTSDSKKLDPLTGEVLADIPCLRGNCTRATGTADSIFARGYRHTGTLRIDLASGLPRRVPAMRPACQDGVIAANGLLYWGPWMCDCNHTLVGVISLAPAGRSGAAPEEASGRLEKTERTDGVLSLDIAPGDWPTYRADNTRSAHAPADVPGEVELAWEHRPPARLRPSAPVTGGGMVFYVTGDGTVRALDAATGEERWRAFTGGRAHYPPAIAEGRLFAGSADGWVYAFEAASGRLLWRFRAAPAGRWIPVYGSLSSTWPVASGVLVEDGVVYAAAGIVSHDGTYVVALRASTGEPIWENDRSGRLLETEGAVAGVSVQGHLLLHDGKLHLAGGNVVSPAVYDTATGECLSRLDDEWQRAPRGSELFLAGKTVVVTDKSLYSPPEYIPSRYFPKYLVEAAFGDLVVHGTDRLMKGVRRRPGAEPETLWEDRGFVRTDAVALARNALVTAGLRAAVEGAPPVPGVVASDPRTGEELWSRELPAAPLPWGIALDRRGRVFVTLADGRLLAFDEG